MTPTFQRDYTAERINAVVNHPGVLPYVAAHGQESLDLGPVLSNLNNIALMCDDGGVLALSVEPGVYEIHTQFTPELRGAAVIKIVRDMIEHLFLATPAIELLTQIPVSNPAALGLVRAIAGRFEFSRMGSWVGLDGQLTDVDYYALRFSDWIWSDWGMKRLELVGHQFHEELESKLEAAGYSEPQHGPDLSHDCMVGATVGMLRQGQLDKAIILYNRWARFAGYAEIQLISRSPVVVNIQNSWLELTTDGGFRVVRTVQQQRQVGRVTLEQKPEPAVVTEAVSVVAAAIAAIEPTPPPFTGNPDLDELLAAGRANVAKVRAATTAPVIDAFTPWTPDAAELAVAEALGLTEKVA